MKKLQGSQNFPDSNMISKVVTVKLYPNQDLLDRFNQLSGNERWVWNRCVAYNKMYHQLFPDNDPVDRFILNPALTGWKKMYPWLKLNDATGLQKVTERFSVTLSNMLRYYKDLKDGKHPRRVGFPKFKSRKQDLHAFGGKVVNRNLQVIDLYHVKLPKFKEPFLTSSTVGLAGWKIKEYRVCRLGDGTYQLNLFVEGENQAGKLTGKIIGVDCNLKNLATLSSGKTYQKFGNHHIDVLVHRSIVYQRKMSRAYDQAKKIMAQEEHNDAFVKHTLEDFADYWKYRRMYNHYNLKIKRIKKHYLNQVANEIVQNYDVIVFEKLAISNMMKNHYAAKSIANASWYEFRSMIAYKALWNNKLCVTVNPAYTTQTCHYCGFVMGSDDDSKKVTLDERQWKCPRCHHTLRRDQNAAINIKNKFLADPDKWLKSLFNQKRLYDSKRFAHNNTNRLWKQSIEGYQHLLK